MQLPDLIILALVEGVADILPIDSTGHALAVSRLVGWRAGSIGASVHLGAAAALLIYLWRDMALIGQDLWKLRKRRVEPGTRLAGKMLLAALPWVAATQILRDLPVPSLADLPLVGSITLIAAVLMGLADKLCMTVKRIEHLGGASALLIGVVQLFALVPGVGRVAAAVTTARLIGLERPEAFRFVLLLNIPILLIDGIGHALQYYLEGRLPADSDLLAFGLTFVFSLVALSVAQGWVRRWGLKPFTAYRLMVGAGLLALAYL